MPLTRKFSEFVAQNVTSVVGLTAGANSIGPNSGGGGGSGAVTQIIIQNNGFSVGQWLRFDEGSNLYVTALANDPENAEVIGVVIAASPTQFTLQQSGYIATAQGIFVGLMAGEPYYLDDAIAGNMVNTDIMIDGEVSRPVFVPDSATSGWVLPYRGIIVGGGQVSGIGPTPPTFVDSNIVTIVQNLHGFVPGDWLRIDTPTAGPNQVHYVKALADTLANSQSVGVVIEVINANEFKLQFSGYISTDGTVFAPFQDSTSALLVPKVVYYLSDTIAGTLTSTDPSSIGSISKPLYISEQTAGTVNTNAGYILPQRPLDIVDSINPVTETITQVNAFTPGQWVYIQANLTYALASAATLAQAQVAGVVLSSTGTTFTIQQSGYITGIVTQDYLAAPISSSTVYYLSTTPGALTPTTPSVAGTISKPCYIQDNFATSHGQILPQRPIVIPSAAPAAGSVIAAVNFDGTAGPAIRSSFNVSSVTRVAVGTYQVNFTAPLPNNTYYYSTSGGNGFATGLVSTNGASGPAAADPTVNNFTFKTFDGPGNRADLTFICCIFYAS